MVGLVVFYQRLFGRAFYEDPDSTEADMVTKLQDEVLVEGPVVEAEAEDVGKIPQRMKGRGCVDGCCFLVVFRSDRWLSVWSCWLLIATGEEAQEGLGGKGLCEVKVGTFIKGSGFCA